MTDLPERIAEVMGPTAAQLRQDLLGMPTPRSRPPPRITSRDLNSSWWHRLAAVLGYLVHVVEQTLSPSGGLRAFGYWLLKVVLLLSGVLLALGALLLIAIPVLALLVEAVWMTVKIVVGIVLLFIILATLFISKK